MSCGFANLRVSKVGYKFWKVANITIVVVDKINVFGWVVKYPLIKLSSKTTPENKQSQ